MRHLEPLLFLAFVAVSSAAGDAARPRGVGPEFAKFYKDGGQFTCISNPSVHLDISQVNDDYCDCPDGSDEPGTSACSYLSVSLTTAELSGGDQNTTLALPGYYCKNKGHRPSYVPFSNVNDGVCDYELCCDGSDEWENFGDVKCENKCKEIGKEWKKQDNERKKSMGAASKRRKELILEAVKLKKQVEEKITMLDVEIRAAQIKVGDLEKALLEVEKREKGRVVKGASKGSRVNVLAGLAKDRIEELRGSLSDVREQRDVAQDKVKELELILSTFKEEYNPNFNDEGVKRAVKAWEDYAASKDSDNGEDNSAMERDLEEILKPDGQEHGIKWDEWEGKEESDVDVLYRFEEYLPKPLRDWIDLKLRDLRVMLVENGILADNGGENESRAVTDARNAYNAAKTDLENMQKDLANQKEDVERDYGEDDVFRALKGSCIEKDSGEYSYELCWFDRTTQVAKKGGGNTGMGNFVRLDKINVDEDLPPDGKGLGSGERVALRFENGQHCWNGPSRSTTVVLACAETDEIWKVVEEEKCVYRMEVGTPVVCESISNGKAKPVGKDEL